MVLGVVAVPEVPAGVLFAVGLLAGLTAVLLFVMRFVIVTLVGSLLRWFAHELGRIPVIGGYIGNWADDGVNAVDRAFGRAIQASEKLALSTFNDAWRLTRFVGDSIAGLAVETAHGFTVLVTHTIPDAAHGVESRGAAAIAAVGGRVTYVERTVAAGLASTLKYAEAKAHAIETTLDRKYEAVSHAIDVTLPGEIGKVIPDIRGWVGEKWDALNGRLSKVEKALGLAALGGVIVGVIAKELPGFDCRNNKSLTKSICSVPVSTFEKILEGLVLGATAIFGTMSLVSFAERVQGLVGDLEGEVAHFWRTDKPGAGTQREFGQSGPTS